MLGIPEDHSWVILFFWSQVAMRLMWSLCVGNDMLERVPKVTPGKENHNKTHLTHCGLTWPSEGLLAPVST